MDDLISRAAAIAQIKENYCDWCDHTDLCKSCETYDCIATIEQHIPAVDAVPIIRCASCKWWNGSTLGAAHRCAALHIATTGEFYCAAAARISNAFADQNGAEYADNPTV